MYLLESSTVFALDSVDHIPFLQVLAERNGLMTQLESLKPSNQDAASQLKEQETIIEELRTEGIIYK